MAMELGRDSTFFELFKKTHYNEKLENLQTIEWLQLMLKASASSTGSVQSHDVDDDNLWLEVVGGKNKKGCLYGFGSENPDIVCASSQRSTPSINTTQISPDVVELRMQITRLTQENQEIRENYQIVKQQNEHLQDKTSKIINALESMGIKLPSES